MTATCSFRNWGPLLSEALTPVGQELAKLPLDPRVALMIVAARDEGCLKEMLVIAAALTAQDPRERRRKSRARPTPRTRNSPTRSRSSFPWLKLWQWYEGELEHKKSNRKLVQACHENFLSALRAREWHDIHNQLHALATEHGWKENQLPANYDAVHRALLSGLLGNIGCKSGRFWPLPRCARHEIPDPPRIGAQQEGRQVDRRGRDHRDDQALRPLRGSHRTRGGWRRWALT